MKNWAIARYVRIFGSVSEILEECRQSVVIFCVSLFLWEWWEIFRYPVLQRCFETLQFFLDPGRVFTVSLFPRRWGNVWVWCDSCRLAFRTIDAAKFAKKNPRLPTKCFHSLSPFFTTYLSSLSISSLVILLLTSVHSFRKYILFVIL